MIISSRTPEGLPTRCPVCGLAPQVEPSDPAGAAPCPRCGHLLWFTWEDGGGVQVIKAKGERLDEKALDRLIESVTIRPGMQLMLDFRGVRQLPSAVIGKLISLKKKAVAVGARVGLRGLHPDLQDTFRFARLDLVFDIEE
jgi:anti-anti-sigma regulatory factor